jgi:murein L,D-transpeptidase YcbB/YkuD
VSKKVSEIIPEYIQSAKSNNNKLSDSTELLQPGMLELIYSRRNNEPLWSIKQNWLRVGDSLNAFIRNAKDWGLFPENYHVKEIDTIHKLFFADSMTKSAKLDDNLWAKADLLLTDAAIQIIYDIRLGRLQNDSVMKRTDSMLTREFIMEKLDTILDTKSLYPVFSSLEPKHKGYREIKDGIKNFLVNADFKSYTHLPFPYKDTVAFRQLLKIRLTEGGYLPDSLAADTASIRAAIKKFQLSKKITADGKAGGETVGLLNNTDIEKFYRIAISLDRYKMLPEKMPDKYIWVNLPSFQLRVFEKDTIKFWSKIVVGKPITRTPVLTSTVYEMITYPKWTIPNSIIVKDILPAMKQNTQYLAKKGYSLFDKNGEEVNPDSVNWSKYSKGIPYNVVQGSGDANALGIMKFNFGNKYQVYMHDTNERYLFDREFRSLSHGCVRVQQWNKMANYLLSYDSTSYKKKDSLRAVRDSVTVWLQKKEKHTISFKNRIPVYFRYFSCEGKDGTIIFYDDIYGEDALLREKYYSHK